MALVTAVVTVAACHKWAPRSEAPSVVVRNETPTSVRLELLDSSLVVLRDPFAVADTVVGETETSELRFRDAEIRGVEARVHDPLGTVLLVLGTTILSFYVFVGVVCAIGACVGPG